MTDHSKKKTINQQNLGNLTRLSKLSKDGETWDLLKSQSVAVGNILKTSPNAKLHKRGILMSGGTYLRRKRNTDGSLKPIPMWEETEGCSTFLKGVFVKDENGERKFRTTNVFRCEDRLCPVCQKVKTARMTFRAFKRMARIYEEEQKLPLKKRHKFIFLTLTVANCEITDLRKTLKDMNVAFNRLKVYPFWQSYVVGFIRKMEVTRNDKDGTAHPHFHVILMVKNEYFQHRQPAVTQDEFALIWKKAMRLDYKPIVDVRSVKPNVKKKTTSLESAMLEVMKYALKFDKALIADPAWLLEYAEQIHKTRAFSAGGLLKDVIKEDLTPEEEEEIDKEIEESETIEEDLGRYWFKYWFDHKFYAGQRDFALRQFNENRRSKTEKQLE